MQCSVFKDFNITSFGIFFEKFFAIFMFFEIVFF